MKAGTVAVLIAAMAVCASAMAQSADVRTGLESGVAVDADSQVVGADAVAVYEFPMCTGYHDSRTQVIYLAGEIGRAGLISGLSLHVHTAPGQTMDCWTVRMKHTTLDSYDTASLDADGWTVCYQGVEPAGLTGWRTFAFTTPFDFNGSDNLMVDFSHNNASHTSPGYCFGVEPGGDRSLIAVSDSRDGDPLTWSGTTPAATHKETLVPSAVLAFGPPVSVTNVTSPHADGTFTVGEVIDIDVTFDAPVSVTGWPQLELETGATDRMAFYLGGSGTATLRFRYIVCAGDMTPDLDCTWKHAIDANGGAIEDPSTGIHARLHLPVPGTAGSLGANKAIVIDTTVSHVPKITVTWPEAGTVWEQGTLQTITWSSVGIPGNVRIYYSISGSTSTTGPWTPVGWATEYQGYNVPNDGEHQWVVDAPVSSNVTILVRSMDQNIPGLTNWWDSDGISQTFTVTPPSNPPYVTVTAPANGAAWQQGTVHNITWDSSGVPGLVKLYYSIDGGASWTGINYSAPNTGHYPWTVDVGLEPSASSLTNVKVRVRSKDTTVLTDDSEGFAILPPSPPPPNPVTLSQTPVALGQVLTIGWPADEVTGDYVKLYYSLNGGVSWVGIHYSAPNTGSYAWTVNAGPSSNARIRVRSKVSYTDFSADSEGFVIGE